MDLLVKIESMQLLLDQEQERRRKAENKIQSSDQVTKLKEELTTVKAELEKVDASLHSERVEFVKQQLKMKSPKHIVN